MARKCLEQIFSKGYKYHKAGIILLDLVPVTFKQLVFDSMDTPERSRLMQTIDKMNTVMVATLCFGSCISHLGRDDASTERLVIRHRGGISEALKLTIKSYLKRVNFKGLFTKKPRCAGNRGM